jgi:antitoxin ParD1/3/4
MAVAKNTSFALGDHFTQFVDKQVASGRYGSASEVVRAALRILEEHEARVEALRDALIEGENSGESGRSMKEIVAEAKAELNVQ